MKKLLGIVVLSLLFNNNLLAEEYPNSWKIDLLCKQGKWQWYEAAYVAVSYTHLTLPTSDLV